MNWNDWLKDYKEPQVLTDDEINLLIKDVSPRLPYDLKASFEVTTDDNDEPVCKNFVVTAVDKRHNNIFWAGGSQLQENGFSNGTTDVSPSNELFKPYLRSLKYMTDDEKDELLTKLVGKRHKHLFKIKKNGEVVEIDDRKTKQWNNIENMHFEYICFTPKSINAYMEFMYSHHFDINGLIKKGLAIEAPADMYKTEK